MEETIIRVCQNDTPIQKVGLLTCHSDIHTGYVPQDMGYVPQDMGYVPQDMGYVPQDIRGMFRRTWGMFRRTTHRT